MTGRVLGRQGRAGCHSAGKYWQYERAGRTWRVRPEAGLAVTVRESTGSTNPPAGQATSRWATSLCSPSVQFWAGGARVAAPRGPSRAPSAPVPPADRLPTPGRRAAAVARAPGRGRPRIATSVVTSFLSRLGGPSDDGAAAGRAPWRLRGGWTWRCDASRSPGAAARRAGRPG